MTDGDDPGSDHYRHDSGYDQLADRAEDLAGWATPWADNPLQREYSWPETRALLPDVSGARVLDAGCGVGDHAAWLLDRGATVTAVDASERAVETARERLGDRATVRRADLSEPLDFALDGGFDGVLSHLVLDHVPDLKPSFEEFSRVLADDGWLVFAMVHPMHDYLVYDEIDQYYGRDPVELTWETSVTAYQRPLADVLEPLAEAGFRLTAFREPEPPDSYVEAAADEWNVDRRPQIVCVRARV
jgi:SAM-dependent methyltransferase